MLEVYMLEGPKTPTVYMFEEKVNSLKCCDMLTTVEWLKSVDLNNI